MAYMELLSDNLINTTTQIIVDSNTDIVSFLFDRTLDTSYETSGYPSNTSTIISIEFETPTIVNNIILQDHNLKQFRAFYDSATANTFSVDINETTNSQTSNYYTFNSVTVSSVQLQMDQAQTADTEKEVSQFIIAYCNIQFERNPTIKQFKPVVKKTQVKHKMPDGGIVLYNISNKYMAKIKFEYISSTFYNQFRTLFYDQNPLYFVPFPTTTSWDGAAYPVLWTGDFDFNYGANVKESGYSGNIILEERTSVG